MRATEAQMMSFESAIQQYRMRTERLPGSLEALTRTDERDPYPFMKSIPRDPWGNAYEYERTGEETYRIRSLGEDGVRDTDDDILWPKDAYD